MSEVSAHGTVEIAADALLSSGLISVPTGADTVAVLFSSLLLGYRPWVRRELAARACLYVDRDRRLA